MAVRNRNERERVGVREEQREGGWEKRRERL